MLTPEHGRFSGRAAHLFHLWRRVDGIAGGDDSGVDLLGDVNSTCCIESDCGTLLLGFLQIGRRLVYSLLQCLLLLYQSHLFLVSCSLLDEIVLVSDVVFLVLIG